MSSTVVSPSIAIPAEPSPSWIGATARWERLTLSDGMSARRRIHDPVDRVFASSPDAIASAMSVAAGAGIAPEVISAEHRHITLRDIGGSPSRLDDYADPSVLARMLSIRQIFHTLDVPDLEDRSRRSDIERLLGSYRTAGLVVPSGVASVWDRVRSSVDAATSKLTPVPSHGDGSASNFLIGPNESVLTGWSVVARRDPVEEAGSVWADLEPVVSMTAILSGLGLPDNVADAVRIQGILDDIFWSLTGFWREGTAGLPDIDFAKYALWRLTKARFAIDRLEREGLL